MKKTFKKVIACMLAVLMAVFSMPFTAFAVSGTYTANITLQFGVVSDENGEGTWVTSGDPAAETQYMTNKNLMINEGFSYLTGPQLEPTATVDASRGVYSVSKLTLQESDINNIEAANAPDGTGMASNAESGDYDLQAGDVFTVTVKLEGVDQMFAGNARIAFSDNIKPAGFYRTGTSTTRKCFVGTDADAAAAAKEYVGFNSPIESASGIGVYERFNTLLGDAGSVITDAEGVSYMDCGMAANGGYPVDVTSVTNEELTATYVDKDGNLGYTYPDQMVWETFVFMIVDDTQPINFWMYDPDNKALSFDGGWCARDAQENYADTKTTYAINGNAAGSAKMTFMGTNVNTCDITVKDENGDPILDESGAPISGTFIKGEKVMDILPALPDAVINNDGTHTVYYWDPEVTEDTVADGDTTYSIKSKSESHNFTSNGIVEEPTCLNGGIEEFSCDVCGAVKEETVSAIGHSMLHTAEKAATCIAVGNVEYYYCSNCESYYSTEEGRDDDYLCDAENAEEILFLPINSQNHVGQPVPVGNGYDATCESDGYTGDTKCSACDAVISYGTTLGRSGHNYGECTSNNDGTHSQVCENDSNHVKTTPCVYDETVVNPKCTERGYTVFTCQYCGHTYNDNFTDALGHEYDEGEVTTPPQCEVAGVKTFICSKCGDKKEESVDPIGHSYNSTVTKPATCTSTGVRTYTCANCSNTYDEPIAKIAHKYVNKVTKATYSADGKIVPTCSACRATKTATVIYKPNKITLSKTSYTYDGTYKKPTVTVKDSKGNKISTSYYTVKYSSNKYVGKATVTITFKGTKYSGTVKKTFKINPKGTTISKLTPTSKGFKATWKKQATQTSGYEIRYSLKSSMASSKTVKVSKNSTVSKSVSKLKGKKKYYVQIRTYKTVNGVKYYSAWSAKKSVTTKK